MKNEEQIPDELLAAVLDSWARNNRILVNLLRALPAGVIEARALPGSMSVREMFAHVIYVRLIFVIENAPEYVPAHVATESARNWLHETAVEKLEEGLNLSSAVAQEAFLGRLEAGKPMDRCYDHPLLFLQHMIWHEGYHHGQIKLAAKAMGQPFDDEEIGPLTWSLFIEKTR